VSIVGVCAYCLYFCAFVCVCFKLFVCVCVCMRVREMCVAYVWVGERLDRLAGVCAYVSGVYLVIHNYMRLYYVLLV